MRMRFHGTRYEFANTAEDARQRDELEAAITLAQPERHTHTYEWEGLLYLSVWRPLSEEPYVAPVIARGVPFVNEGTEREMLVYDKMLYDDNYVAPPVVEPVETVRQQSKPLSKREEKQAARIAELSMEEQRQQSNVAAITYKVVIGIIIFAIVIYFWSHSYSDGYWIGTPP